jgi:hypothetical protein
MLTIAQNLLGLRGGNYWNIEKIEIAFNSNSTSFGSSMYTLVFNNESISVSIVSLIANCGLFQMKPELSQQTLPS